jgi:hypothetical protein
VHRVLPPRSSVIERNILKQSWRKCLPELKINHYIVPFGSTDESRDCTGNCFAYNNDKPAPAVHKEKLGRPIAEHDALWGDSRWGNISESWVLTMLTMTWLAPGLAFLPGRFFWHTYEQKMCNYLIYLKMTGSIKFTVRKISLKS